MRFRITPPPRLEGVITPPGDKSISHRAAILNAIAQGEARISRFCPGDDGKATLRCLQALGVSIRQEGGRPLVVRGTGGELREPEGVLNAGQSGTTIRLLPGVLAGQPFLSVLTGHPQLLRRPMDRVVHPLRLMGATVLARQGGSRPPLVIKGGALHGIDYTLPVASAQVKSCILLAGLFARGETVLREPAPSRDHTERMLTAMGARVSCHDRTITLRPGGALKALGLEVPGDFSSAAFWLVAGAVHPSARITLRAVGVNPTRAGLLEVLRAMGARIALDPLPEVAGEPVAHITVESSPLQGVEVSGDLVPRLIDELVVLAVAGCFARGATVIRGAGELRVKESDRIRNTVRELRRMGARVEELPDGMVVHGGGGLQGATVYSHGDHRLAMALAVAGLCARGETVVAGAECVAKSYPGFWDDLRSLAQGVGR